MADTTTTAASLNTLAPHTIAVGLKLWAYRVPDEHASFLNGPERRLLHVRLPRPDESQNTKDSVYNKPENDDAGTFFLDREKDTTDAVAGETVVVVGYVIPGDVFIQNEANIKRNNEKSIEDMGRIFNPVVQDVANVGLVVKPIGHNSSKKGFFVLTERQNGYCVPKCLKRGAVTQRIAFLRTWLPRSENISKPKQWQARLKEIKQSINEYCDGMNATQPVSPTTGHSSSSIPINERKLPERTTAYDALYGAIQRILAQSHSPSGGFDNAGLSLASHLTNAYLNEPDPDSDLFLVHQLLCKRGIDFPVEKCREVAEVCKAQWPEQVNEKIGVFKPAALYSLGLALREKKNDDYTFDFKVAVDPSHYLMLIMMYTSVYHMAGAPMPIYEDTTDRLSRLGFAWEFAKTLPRSHPYEEPKGSKQVSEKAAREALRDMHKCLKLCAKTADQVLLDGARLYGFEGRGSGPLSVPGALELKAHHMGSKHTDRLVLKTIEQNAFLNTWRIFQPVIDTHDQLAKAIEAWCRNNMGEERTPSPGRSMYDGWLSDATDDDGLSGEDN